MKTLAKYLEVGTNPESSVGKYSTLNWKGFKGLSRGDFKRSLLPEFLPTTASNWKYGPRRSKVPCSELSRYRWRIVSYEISLCLPWKCFSGSMPAWTCFQACGSASPARPCAAGPLIFFGRAKLETVSG